MATGTQAAAWKTSRVTGDESELKLLVEKGFKTKERFVFLEIRNVLIDNLLRNFKVIIHSLVVLMLLHGC